MAKLRMYTIFPEFSHSSLIPSSCQHTGAFTHFNPRCDNWYNSPACLTDKCIYRAFLTKQFCVPSISKSRWLRYKDISKPIFFLNPRNLQVCWHSFKVPLSSLIPSSCQHTRAFTHFDSSCNNWYNSPACLTDKCIYLASLTKQFCVPSISTSRWLRYTNTSRPIFFLIQETYKFVGILSKF